MKKRTSKDRPPSQRLIDAVYESDAKTVRKELRKGVFNVNLADSSGDTLLCTAAMRGSLEIVQFLLDAGADVNLKDSHDGTPLHHASGRGHGATVRLLLEKGALVDVFDQENNAPLHTAIRNGCTGVVAALLEHGADPNVQGEEGLVLQLACSALSADIVHLLLEKGADPRREDGCGCTALHAAAHAGRYENAILLLDAGADPCARDGDGWTPLHSLAESHIRNAGSEQIIDWYREHHPELVMEVYCTQTNGPGGAP